MSGNGPSGPSWPEPAGGRRDSRYGPAMTGPTRRPRPAAHRCARAGVRAYPCQCVGVCHHVPQAVRSPAVLLGQRMVRLSWGRERVAEAGQSSMIGGLTFEVAAGHPVVLRPAGVLTAVTGPRAAGRAAGLSGRSASRAGRGRDVARARAGGRGRDRPAGAGQRGPREPALAGHADRRGRRGGAAPGRRPARHPGRGRVVPGRGVGRDRAGPAAGAADGQAPDRAGPGRPRPRARRGAGVLSAPGGRRRPGRGPAGRLGAGHQRGGARRHRDRPHPAAGRPAAAHRRARRRSGSAPHRRCRRIVRKRTRPDAGGRPRHRPGAPSSQILGRWCGQPCGFDQLL